MSLNVSTQMDNLGTALATITGLRVFDFTPDNAYPPFAVVSMPEEVRYDNTAQRGTDEAVFEITVAVGKVSDRSARDQLAAYLAGTGSSSVKAAVDSSGLRRVESARVVVITLGANEYLAAVFSVRVTA